MMKAKFPAMLAYLALFLTVICNDADAKAPTASYWEIADRWTNQIGLGRSLKEAGFQAQPLDPSAGVPRDADVVIFGSFLSEQPEYRSWTNRHAAAIAEYLRGGGVVVQLTQADQTESSPAFLPKGLSVRRTDRDGAPVKVVADDHPLVATLPRTSGQKTHLALPMHHRRGSWETLHQQRGFRVLLTLDEQNRDPVLIEAAVGNGRLVLTSLFFDKLGGGGNIDDAPAEFAAASRAFFKGLRRYVEAVGRGEAPEVRATPAYQPPQPLAFVPGSVTFAVLPDTQVYAQSYPQHFIAQTEWIKKNRERYGIAAVFHEGDITNRNTPEQWENAQRAMRILFGELPMIVAPGNHDMGPGGNGSTHASLMSEYLTPEDFAKHDSFAGTMEAGRTENNYSLFEAGGREWIGIALEWAPRDRTVAWADDLLTRHADRAAVIVTHAYMYYDETKYDHQARQDQRWSPYNYGVRESPEGINDAGDLWRKLIDRHDNVAMVLSGHVLADGAGRLSEPTRGGNVVHQMLANYQMLDEGGQGWMRLIELLPDGQTVQVKTYSPVLDRFNTDPQHQFKLKLAPSIGRSEASSDR